MQPLPRADPDGAGSLIELLMDEWVLIDYRPVSKSGARGLVLGTAYSIGGELLASTAQEVVIRSGAPR
jgi:acyl-CoA thioesterase